VVDTICQEESSVQVVDFARFTTVGAKLKLVQILRGAKAVQDPQVGLDVVCVVLVPGALRFVVGPLGA